jgi:type II secretory ATPase GspE/PulE/Tfp pilus assembly ATPase PilB-like protein
MLRYDPDVMMVGEVRDRETAEIAIQTAMTGHLVLSTLHTNDAASAAVRLVDMGVDSYLITATVLSFVAQRLVRLICTECREPYDHEGHRLYRGKGCRACNGCGYRGRLAISEFLLMEPEIQRMILEKASAADIRSAANRLGMETLAQDGWQKVEAGQTTADEVLRVTRL